MHAPADHTENANHDSVARVLGAHAAAAKAGRRMRDARAKAAAPSALRPQREPAADPANARGGGRALAVRLAIAALRNAIPIAGIVLFDWPVPDIVLLGTFNLAMAFVSAATLTCAVRWLGSVDAAQARVQAIWWAQGTVGACIGLVAFLASFDGAPVMEDIAAGRVDAGLCWTAVVLVVSSGVSFWHDLIDRVRAVRAQVPAPQFAPTLPADFARLAATLVLTGVTLRVLVLSLRFGDEGALYAMLVLTPSSLLMDCLRAIGALPPSADVIAAQRSH